LLNLKLKTRVNIQ